MRGVWPYIAALLPSAAVGFLFWLVIKNMIEGDRRERLAQSQWEKEQQTHRAGTTPDNSGQFPNGEKIYAVPRSLAEHLEWDRWSLSLIHP